MASRSPTPTPDTTTISAAKRTAVVGHHHTPAPLTLIGANIRPDSTSQDHPHSPSADEHQDVFLPLTTPSDFVFPSVSTTPRSASHHARHHSRVHSRNLSVFFPRPGQQPVLPPTPHSPAQVLDIPPANTNSQSPSIDSRSPGSSTAKGRRGHHHRHSLSHNFFPFLPPNPLSSQCPPTPSSAASAIPKTVPCSTHHHSHQVPSLSSSSLRHHHQFSYTTLILAVLGAGAGAAFWVSGSLAHVGLGYLAVSDSLWSIYHCLKPQKSESLRRPFGSARDQILASFTRAVYLIFAAIYVCKEAFEQIILPVHGHHQSHDHLSDKLCLIIVIVTTATVTPNPSPKRYTTAFFGSILLISSFLLSPSDQDILNKPTALLEILAMLHDAIPEAINKGLLLLQTSPLQSSSSSTSSSDENSNQISSLKTGLEFIKRNETRVQKVYPPKIWRLDEDRIISNVKLGVNWKTLSGSDAVNLVAGVRSALSGVGDDLSVDLVSSV